MEMPVEKIHEVLAVNVGGAFLAPSTSRRRASAAGARSSTSPDRRPQSTLPTSDAAGYSASKGGLIAHS
jgi:hypothetical protein